MTERFVFYPLEGDHTIRVENDLDYETLDQDLRRQIDQHWESLQSNGKLLYDGWVFSMISTDPWTGRFVPYRCHTAALHNAHIKEILNIQPMGISGIVHSDQRVLLGMRSHSLVHFGGLYEFPPSGGVDKECANEGYLDWYELALRELEEETSLTTQDIIRLSLLGITYDTIGKTYEFVVDIQVQDKTFDKVPALTVEYPNLYAYTFSELEELLATKPCVALSPFLWDIVKAQKSR